MKLLKNALALTVCAALMFACSDESPEVSQMTIKEDMSNDGGMVVKEDAYVYENDKLVKHVTTQEFYGQSISSAVTLSYFNQKVLVKDDEGNTAVYTLGSDGYATQCAYQFSGQARVYTFHYDQGYLVQLDETIEGQAGNSNTLTYRQGDLIGISNAGTMLQCEPGGTVNSASLPDLILRDIYPLSLHLDAMYAGILGQPAQHLVGKMMPIAEDNKEITEYTYTTDATGKVTGVQEKLTYTGTLIDIYGNAYESQSTETRKLSIEYENR